MNKSHCGDRIISRQHWMSKTYFIMITFCLIAITSCLYDIQCFECHWINSCMSFDEGIDVFRTILFFCKFDDSIYNRIIIIWGLITSNESADTFLWSWTLQWVCNNTNFKQNHEKTSIKKKHLNAMVLTTGDKRYTKFALIDNQHLIKIQRKRIKPGGSTRGVQTNSSLTKRSWGLSTATAGWFQPTMSQPARTAVNLACFSLSSTYLKHSPPKPIQQPTQNSLFHKTNNKR